MTELLVKKRDGKFVDYDRAKIIRAILAGELTSDSIAANISNDITALIEESGFLTVEEIQDHIEHLLMVYGEFKAAKHFILYRTNRSNLRSVRLKPDTLAISDYIHFSKYSRFQESLGRRETWYESVSRLSTMHCDRWPELATEITEIFGRFVVTKRVLPSMRSVQFGGAAIEANHARMFNCSFTLIDRPRVFAELFFLLLSGCGVGYSVQFQHVAKLLVINKINTKVIITHTVEDSIEGWAEALNILIQCYMSNFSHPYIEFDYTEIRPEGTPLKTSGGLAPGHIPLKLMLETIRGMLNNATGRQLKPIECHDICCIVAEAVLSGGIRRSSLIALFSPLDAAMMECKTGAWYREHPYRQMANNSAVLLRETVDENQFKLLFKYMREFGEPGFFLTNDLNWGTNPCLSSWGRVLTDGGIKTIGEIQIGTVIWSGQRWTKVTKKWCTGTKQVFAYHTHNGTFFGTDNHRVVSNGLKVEVKNATSIDICSTPEHPAPQGANLIVKIVALNIEPVYDITVDAEEHTFWYEGLLVSNCGEIGLDPIDYSTGETGFAFCNLTEINGAMVSSEEDFYECAKAATFIGTLQAAYTDFPYLTQASRNIAERDALLGVSITGVMDSQIVRIPGYQQVAVDYCKYTNSELAERLEINSAARITCIKPSGTASLLLGCVGSGHHPHHSRRYIRRITANKIEKTLEYFKLHNPHMVIEKPNGDFVIEFPVEAPSDAIVNGDLTALEFMEEVMSTYENWIKPGTIRESLTHNVSCTVTVKDSEWDLVSQFAWENRHRIASMSFLPELGDKIYPYAPREAIVSVADEARYNELISKYVPVDWTKLIENTDNTVPNNVGACEGAACEVNFEKR